MSFEKEIASTNEYFFFKEFTYSKTTFRPQPGFEVELADNLVWLEDNLIVFQLKERAQSKRIDPQGEQTWYENKVIRKATKQIRDTLRYIEDNAEIALVNHRGHAFHLKPHSIRNIHKLIVYLPHQQLSKDTQRRYYPSETAGIIHLMTYHDYSLAITTLITPAEFLDYLAFREQTIREWKQEALILPEVALIGYYLFGNIQERPTYNHSKYLESLQAETETWDISNIIRVFSDRVTYQDYKHSQYPIIRELAKLDRSSLQKFKERFIASMQKSAANEFTLPFRMSVPATQCGFVFLPLIKSHIDKRRDYLQNLTLAHKYEQRLGKCIGVSFSPSGDGWFDIEWAYNESSWEYNAEIEKLLNESYPFRKLKTNIVHRYHFID